MDDFIRELEESGVYDCCQDPRCGHYRCEHDIHCGPPIYVAPGREPFAPDGFDINGCANADCPCEKFKERESSNG